ncbi:MAG: hypothetical protein ACRELB_08730 [Polyangiaceae bacterium]
MAKSLKDKVTEALLEAAGKDATIHLDDVPPDKIGGFVLSSSFANESGVARQDRIWDALDRHLDKHERTRIVFIVTDTPDEYEAIKKAAG